MEQKINNSFQFCRYGMCSTVTLICYSSSDLSTLLLALARGCISNVFIKLSSPTYMRSCYLYVDNTISMKSPFQTFSLVDRSPSRIGFLFAWRRWCIRNGRKCSSSSFRSCNCRRWSRKRHLHSESFWRSVGNDFQEFKNELKMLKTIGRVAEGEIIYPWPIL